MTLEQTIAATEAKLFADLDLQVRTSFLALSRTGLRVRVNDPAAVADAILRLLSNEVLRRRMGHRAACYAEDYSWTKIVDKLIGVYEEIT